LIQPDQLKERGHFFLESEKRKLTAKFCGLLEVFDENRKTAGVDIADPASEHTFNALLSEPEECRSISPVSSRTVNAGDDIFSIVISLYKLPGIL
jgi:hypothetical protein